MNNDDILRDKFLSLLRLRAFKVLDTLRSHIEDRGFFRVTNMNIKNSDTLINIVYILSGLLEKLKKFPPYSHIKDWYNSPVILVDVDSTLFERSGDPCRDNHCFGEPIEPVISIVNELYECGCIIKIYTGRMNQYISGIDKSVKGYLQKALKKANVKYHTILEVAKPNAEVILDDLSINPIL